MQPTAYKQPTFCSRNARYFHHPPSAHMIRTRGAVKVAFHDGFHRFEHIGLAIVVETLFGRAAHSCDLSSAGHPPLARHA